MEWGGGRPVLALHSEQDQERISARPAVRLLSTPALGDGEATNGQGTGRPGHCGMDTAKIEVPARMVRALEQATTATDKVWKGMKGERKGERSGEGDERGTSLGRC